MDGFNNEVVNNEDVVSNGNYQDYTSDVQNNPYQPAPAEEEQGASGLAVASLVFGILAIVTGCCTGCLGIILGIVGIIMAVVAKKNGTSGVGKGGLVCSIIGLVIGIIMSILIVVYFYAVGAMAMEMAENPEAYMQMMEGELSEDEMEEMMKALEELEGMY